MTERNGLSEAMLLLITAVFALFGAGSRMLRESPRALTIAQSIGNLMTSVFSALLIGFALLESVGQQAPYLFIAITGAAAWLGGDIVDRIARRLIDHNGPT